MEKVSLNSTFSEATTKNANIFLSVNLLNISNVISYSNGSCLALLENVTHKWTGPNSTLDNIQVQRSSPIISDALRDIILTVNLAVLCQFVSLAGVVVSILNICVFVKQGLGDALNVTLAGLAFADLCMVIFASWMCLCCNPLFASLDLPFSPIQFVYLTASLPRLTCSRVSSWILAFASVERCLCIMKPLAFKSIITPRRSLAFIVVTYVVMTASVLPLYYTTRLVWSHDPARNKSIVSLAFTSDRFAVDNYVFGIGVFLSVVSFLGVSICTSLLVWSLKKKRKWRETTVVGIATGNHLPLVSYRNKRVGKMISIVSILFLVCYTPNTASQLLTALVQDFAKNGDQINAGQVFWSFGILLECINATVSIVIYFKISSRFRSTLLAMFKRKPRPACIVRAF
ncbi:adenosine receptor A1 [Biomphalaria glabrata]|uniref:Adenosine receptor A1-like n=1 Tax=Biomphalaria glabrata TaxID=6526 RepID=A0A9U8EAI7_BIOGL|nr:adenosine receptor A1-like [Biomphalaria glabrata]KAI8745155.1 adenosine receptor A1-like [Biomphalaria glabrata]